jgi:hypothetical protein
MLFRKRTALIASFSLCLFSPVTAALVMQGCATGEGSDDGESEPQPLTGGGGGGDACSIGALALQNVGAGACSTNSKGGMGFGTSCKGNGGEPEYWCSDFAIWTWQNSGADVSGLTAAAGSFYTYGQANDTLHDAPEVGDAVVFDYSGGGYADHVAIVTKVNSDGSIETVSGDWNGDSGSEAHFASTSQATLNSPAYPGTVGSEPSIMDMTISAFVGPVGISSCLDGGSGGAGKGADASGGKGGGDAAAHGGGGTKGSGSGGTKGKGSGGTKGKGSGGTKGKGSGGTMGKGSGGTMGTGGGYSFFAPKSPDRRHTIALGPGESETVAFAWHQAPGLAPPADLWIEAGGRRLLQVASVGNRPFVRVGMDLVPLTPEARYRLLLDRADDSLTIAIAGPSGTLLRTQTATSAPADIILPAAEWRSAIVSESLE